MLPLMKPRVSISATATSQIAQVSGEYFARVSVPAYLDLLPSTKYCLPAYQMQMEQKSVPDLHPHLWINCINHLYGFCNYYDTRLQFHMYEVPRELFDRPH